MFLSHAVFFLTSFFVSKSAFHQIKHCATKIKFITAVNKTFVKTNLLSTSVKVVKILAIYPKKFSIVVMNDN